MRRIEIIKVAGKDWAVGLSWRSFSQRPGLRERREEARSLRADWVVLRETHDIAQAGFCAAIVGRKPQRLYALAATIAEEYKQPWMGVFQLQDNLWWYIAVRDGQAILPDGDIVGDYATILEVRRRHEAYGDWTMHEGTIEDLTPLLEFARRSNDLARIKSVEPPPIWKLLLPAVLVVFTLVVVGMIYVHHRRQVHRAAHQAFVDVIRAREQSLSPLVKTSPPDTWLAACKAALGSQRLAENGWLADKVSCAGDTITIHWQRLGNATVLSMPTGNLSDDGNGVLQEKPLGHMPLGQNMIIGYIKEDEQLFALLQPIGVQVSLGKATRFSGQTFFTQPVNFTLPISPFDINFNQVIGLRITSLDWTTTGWDIGGTIYGQ